MLTNLCDAFRSQSRSPNIVFQIFNFKKYDLEIRVRSHPRSISNLSFLSKTIERIVVEQLNRYLTSNCLLPRFQSASVLLSRPFLGLETKTETLDFRSRDLAIRSRDRDLDKMNLSALESQDHGLEITTVVSIKEFPFDGNCSTSHYVGHS